MRRAGATIEHLFHYCKLYDKPEVAQFTVKIRFTHIFCHLQKLGKACGKGFQKKNLLTRVPIEFAIWDCRKLFNNQKMKVRHFLLRFLKQEAHIRLEPGKLII